MSNLHIYNSLTRKREKFVPKVAGKIGMYVCGITVYDDCHLGHARTAVAFDVITRYMRNQNYHVHFVRNITDVDDKIIKRAAERNIPIDTLTSQYIASMHSDFAMLNINPPDAEPRATEHMVAIIKVIERLIAREFAYVSAEGDVCYAVSAFADYGKLAHKDIDGLLAGARVEIAEGKRSPLDFVLWKRAKAGEPGWESPWGIGRPGWHIECSAMAMDALGENFDIHGGGLDLQFPHHENEIAQSEGATGKQFANYWLHVGMLQINQEKMAKSAGNFLTIKTLLAQYHPEVLRYFLLSSQYRSSLNYSDDNLLHAGRGLTRMYQALADVPLTGDESPDIAWVAKFNAAMDDDFNTPEALAVLFNVSRELNKSGDSKLAVTLKYLGSILGILQQEPTVFLQSGICEIADDAISAETIENFIAERNAARREKSWQRADEIRQLLLDAKVELEDTPDGTKWRRM